MDASEIPDLAVKDWWLRKRRIPPPSILQLEVTKNCNLKCVFCHKGQCDKFVRDDISDIVIKQVAPVFPHLRVAMLFGDGEPLLYKGFWKLVQEIRAASPRCVIDFISNGTTLTPSNVDRCLEYKISHIGVSLAGATPEVHNSLRLKSDLGEIADNLMYLKEKKEAAGTLEPYVSAYYTVLKSNVSQLPQFIRFCQDMGCYSVGAQSLIVTHPSMESETVSDEELVNYVNLAEEEAVGGPTLFQGKGTPLKNPADIFFNHGQPYRINEGYCKDEQPWNTAYVLHDGTVVPDCHWWTSAVSTELNQCGKIDACHSLLDIWHGDVYSKIRSQIQQGNILSQCRGCGLCGGVRQEYRSEKTDHSNPSFEGLQEKTKRIAPFDLLMIETCYLTMENALPAALKSIAQYASSLRESMRVVFCINDGADKLQEKSKLIDLVKKELAGFNLVFMDCGAECYNQYEKTTDPYDKVNTRYPSLKHGTVLYEYAKRYAKSDFTLLTHSDIFLLRDIVELIERWQDNLRNNENAAAITPWIHFPQPARKVAECMDSAFCLWKTELFRRYACEKEIPLWAITLDGTFFDTCAYVLKSLREDGLSVLEDLDGQQFVSHKCSQTSLQIYGNKEEEQVNAVESVDVRFDYFKKRTCTISTADNEEHNLIINFASHSASDINNAKALIKVMEYRGLISSKCKTLDVGAGRGVLAKILLEKGIDAYALDGVDYGVKNGIIECPLERYAVFDFSQTISGLKRFFDLTTSFEVLEHIPEDLIPQVVDNFAELSYRLFCSIHIGGGTSSSHQSIRPKSWWNEQFSRRGLITEVSVPIAWDESYFLIVDFI